MPHTPPFAFPPPRTTAAEYIAAMNRAAEEMNLRMQVPRLIVNDDTFTQLFPRKPKRGDKVHVVTEGYVQRVNADGTYVIAANREPYADPITLDSVERAVFIERDTRAPIKVGDIITGRRVRETPWRRGTVLTDADDYYPHTYVLQADGHWLNVSDYSATFGFDAFDDDEKFLVAYAPGK